jgi:hypothetical protein
VERRRGRGRRRRGALRARPGRRQAPVLGPGAVGPGAGVAGLGRDPRPAAAAAAGAAGARYTGNQLPEETIEDLVRRSASLEQTFYTFRASLDGERVTNNVLLDVLRDERDSARRREAWEASKQWARGGRAAARAGAPPQRGRPLAWLRQLLRDGAPAPGAGRGAPLPLLDGLKEESDPRLPPAPRRDRRDPGGALRRRAGGAAPLALGRLFGQEVPSVSQVDLDDMFGGVDLERPRRSSLPGSGCRWTTCCGAATCTSARARTSTPSARRGPRGRRAHAVQPAPNEKWDVHAPPRAGARRVRQVHPPHPPLPAAHPGAHALHRVPSPCTWGRLTRKPSGCARTWARS